MTSTPTTFCRLCEAGCGLVAEIGEDGRVDAVHPDTAHPVTAGFACNKGLLSVAIHRDPARLDQPQRRTDEGTFADEGWDEALDDIATRLGALVAAHGPSAVALYLGNPTAFNATAGPAAGLFMLQLGSDRLFTAASQDCANKFAIAEMLWGSAQVHLVADVDRTDHILLLGTNPRVSKGSFLAMPDPVGRLASIEARGGVVRFVDPRRGEPNVGETVRIKPDTDVYLLAAMLHEIDRSIGFDTEGAARVRELDELRSFLAAFPPERVAPVVGIDEAMIARMAHEFATARAASAHCSTGVNMGRHGALAYWLLHMLLLLTGNLDRPGGNIAVSRATAPPPRSRGVEVADYVDSPWGSFRPTSGGMPGALLADMITASDKPIRALLCTAGNPLLTIGGGERLRDALAGLDLLVSIDYYRNATGELAHHVLPAADWYEREDLNSFVQGMQVEPFVQWTPALVPPHAARRTERDIFAALSDRLGHTPILGPDADILAMLHDAPLGAHGSSVAELRRTPGGVIRLPDLEPGGFLDGAVADGMVDASPAMLEPARQRALDAFDELAAEPPTQLKLITRRTSHTLNTAMQNVERLKQGPGADNPLYLAPEDAARLGVVDGGRVRVWNAFGSIEANAKLDDTLRTGVVAMTHGFGNAQTSGQPVARRHPGVNVNALSPTGAGSFDPVSTMSHLTGIPVEVAAI